MCVAMKIKDAKRNLVNTYTKKYGFPEAEIERLLLNGIEEYNLSVCSVYNGLRMMLGEKFKENEYFSLSEISEMLDCTEEEVLHQIESLNLIENEDNREQPQKKFKLFFPKGIK